MSTVFLLPRIHFGGNLFDCQSFWNPFNWSDPQMIPLVLSNPVGVVVTLVDPTNVLMTVRPWFKKDLTPTHSYSSLPLCSVTLVRDSSSTKMCFHLSKPNFSRDRKGDPTSYFYLRGWVLRCRLLPTSIPVLYFLQLRSFWPNRLLRQGLYVE